MPIKKTSGRSGYDIISIGNATLDHFVKVDSASLLCSINNDNCWLCLNYAEKIPVNEFTSTIGGNACNNAVGSSRLGMKAAFYSIIGDDDTGEKILDLVKREGVSLEYLQVQKRSASNTSIAIRYRTERTILVYGHPRNYRLPQLGRSSWIYLTALGNGFRPVHTALLRQIDKTGASIAFNPGPQELFAGTKTLRPILKRCKVLIVNKEESRTLLGNHKQDTPAQLLEQLHILGPEIVVITDGEHGAYASDGHKQYRMKPAPAKVLERTGAGDSFSTGFLAALTHGKSIGDALAWGAANSASVIEYVGPQAGLLTMPKLLARIKKGRTRAEEI